MPSIKHKHHYAFHRPGPRVRAALVIAAVAVFGYLAVSLINAAAFTGSSEAESGAPGGNAGAVTIAGASGDRAVTFGAAALETPANLRAFTGGNSIALVWDMAQSVTQIEVFRDDAKLATVTKNTGVMRGERLGTRYFDKSAASGATYRYKVRAVNASGAASAFSSSVTVSNPANRPAVPTVTIDASQATDLTAYLTNHAKPEIEAWYPKMASVLADYTPYNNIRLYMDPANDGVAYVGGSMPRGTISVNPVWLRSELEDGGGMFLHEATHILQSYPSDPTGWATEGIADWVRDWMTRERTGKYPGPEAKLTDGYSDSAYMLQWADTKYSAGVIRKLNTALNKNTYTGSFMQSHTGKTAEALFAEAKSQHYSPIGAIVGLGNKCLEVAGSSSASGAKLQLATCNTAVKGQAWSIIYLDAGLLGTTRSRGVIVNGILGDGYRCFTLQSSSTANNTPVYSWPCTYSGVQQWVFNANGTIRNPLSNRCLSTTNDGSENGNQPLIRDCTTSSGQIWAWPK